MLLTIVQSTLAIFIFFIGNTLTNARFMPNVFGGLYEAIPSFVMRMIVLGLPVYAIGILMLANAFDKNASLTAPTILFANIVAAVFTAMMLDGLTFNWKIMLAVCFCLLAEVMLYLALRSAA